MSDNDEGTREVVDHDEFQFVVTRYTNILGHAADDLDEIVEWMDMDPELAVRRIRQWAKLMRAATQARDQKALVEVTTASFDLEARGIGIDGEHVMTPVEQESHDKFD